MSKKALVFLAKGAEEMEAVIAIDVLRRAEVKVTVAGVEGPSPVTCSRNVVIVPDCSVEHAQTQGPFDAVVLPGGLTNSQIMAASSKVKEILQEQEAAGRLIAAICAAPCALKEHGIKKGSKITSYPSLKEKCHEGYDYQDDKVVVDGELITSRGPGTAFDFALAIVNKLCGADEVAKLKAAMLLD